MMNRFHLALWQRAILYFIACLVAAGLLEWAIMGSAVLSWEGLRIILASAAAWAILTVIFHYATTPPPYDLDG